MPAQRKPQINFQVDRPLKMLYDEAKASGHWVSRFCAAGLLLMIEDPAARHRAFNRLREWEAEYADSDEEDIRAFVEGVHNAMLSATRGRRPKRQARCGKKTAKRAGS